jgi:uncharacterized protein YdeI (YjbR/CyaY-like superfamily)
MKKKIESVEEFFSFGCGRCERGGTPACKVRTWERELQSLRKIALSCELEETLKWSFPCFTWEGKNVVLLGAFNEHCSLNFFNGSLLKDPDGILVKAGENSREGRLAKFTSEKEIQLHKKALIACIEDAIEMSRKGLKRDSSADELRIPEELTAAFNKDPKLREAFFNLTPGRQRGYVLHFTQAKQSLTRLTRIEKCKGKILKGLGFHDLPKVVDG